MKQRDKILKITYIIPRPLLQALIWGRGGGGEAEFCPLIFGQLQGRPPTHTHSHLAKCEGTPQLSKVLTSWLWACTHSFIHCILSLRMGLPKIITTDNGTKLKNELNKLLMDLPGIDHSIHRLTTVYHPQACNMSAFILSMLESMLQ